MSTLGDALYDILPAVYRTRDTSGDLQRYLSGAGDLLDAVLATLRQRMADNFPDQPFDPLDPACQRWLLPYFAALVDAQLLAPTADGQRDEIANAVRWRQGKGTLATIDSVFESLGQTEAVTQEGWRRVATTARIDDARLPPARAAGYATEPERGNPGSAARHPALPAVTVDLRCPSRALLSGVENAGARPVTINGTRVLYRQGSPHGAPCFPESYEDVSLRTVDVRTPDWRVGHHHPRRVVAHVPPPEGFFARNAPSVNWSATPSARFLELIDVSDDDGTTVYRNRTLGSRAFVPVRIRRRVELGTPPGHAGDPNAGRWRFEGIWFESGVEVHEGRVHFVQCAARAVVCNSVDTTQPTIDAEDSLFGRVQNARGLARLVYVTVLGDCLSETLEASDSIFLGPIREDHPDLGPPTRGCVRFSRIEPAQDTGGMARNAVTRDLVPMLSTQYGEPSCGVLHPSVSRAIATGAEDEGELGAYHHRHHLRALAAMASKTAEFLPIGMRAVISYDARLTTLPHSANDS